MSLGLTLQVFIKFPSCHSKYVLTGPYFPCSTESESDEVPLSQIKMQQASRCPGRGKGHGQNQGRGVCERGRLGRGGGGSGQGKKVVDTKKKQVEESSSESEESSSSSESSAEELIMPRKCHPSSRKAQPRGRGGATMRQNRSRGGRSNNAAAKSKSEKKSSSPADEATVTVDSNHSETPSTCETPTSFISAFTSFVSKAANSNVTEQSERGSSKTEDKKSDSVSKSESKLKDLKNEKNNTLRCSSPQTAKGQLEVKVQEDMSEEVTARVCKCGAPIPNGSLSSGFETEINTELCQTCLKTDVKTIDSKDSAVETTKKMVEMDKVSDSMPVPAECKSEEKSIKSAGKKAKDKVETLDPQVSQKAIDISPEDMSLSASKMVEKDEISTPQFVSGSGDNEDSSKNEKDSSEVQTAESKIVTPFRAKTEEKDLKSDVPTATKTERCATEESERSPKAETDAKSDSITDSEVPNKEAEKGANLQVTKRGESNLKPEDLEPVAAEEKCVKCGSVIGPKAGNSKGETGSQTGCSQQQTSQCEKCYCRAVALSTDGTLDSDSESGSESEDSHTTHQLKPLKIAASVASTMKQDKGEQCGSKDVTTGSVVGKLESRTGDKKLIKDSDASSYTPKSADSARTDDGQKVEKMDTSEQDGDSKVQADEKEMKREPVSESKQQTDDTVQNSKGLIKGDLQLVAKPEPLEANAPDKVMDSPLDEQIRLDFNTKPELGQSPQIPTRVDTPMETDDTESKAGTENFGSVKNETCSTETTSDADTVDYEPEDERKKQMRELESVRRRRKSSLEAMNLYLNPRWHLVCSTLR